MIAPSSPSSWATVTDMPSARESAKACVENVRNDEEKTVDSISTTGESIPSSLGTMEIKCSAQRFLRFGGGMD